MRIEELKKHYRIRTRWRAFPLHPEIPEKGLMLQDLFKGRITDIKRTMNKLKAVADELGLPFADREMTYNSRLAQEAAKGAEEMGKGEEYHMAVFKAYFSEGRNIADREVLIDIIRAIGLAESEAWEILESNRFKAAVDEDWSLSRAWSITAVPTFLLDHQSPLGRLVGAQPYLVLERFMQNHQVRHERSET